MVREFHIKRDTMYLKFIVFFSLLLSCSSSKITSKNDLKDNAMVKCLIKQTGIDWDAYYITLNNDCTYTIKKGELLKGQDLSSNNVVFQKITDSQTININETDCKKLKTLILSDREEKIQTISGLRKGGWNIYLSIEDRKHQFNLKDVNDSSSINQVFYIMKDLSPIDINLQWR